MFWSSAKAFLCPALELKSMLAALSVCAALDGIGCALPVRTALDKIGCALPVSTALGPQEPSLHNHHTGVTAGCPCHACCSYMPCLLPA